MCKRTEGLRCYSHARKNYFQALEILEENPSKANRFVLDETLKVANATLNRLNAKRAAIAATTDTDEIEALTAELEASEAYRAERLAAGDNEGADAYDAHGYDLNGVDANGYERNGFNDAGIHRDTNTLYNTDGYDREGVNSNGWTKYDVVSDDDIEYWVRGNGNIKGNISKLTGTPYGVDGFNIYGFDKASYDRQGFARYGDYGTGKVDREGYNANGLYVGEEGHIYPPVWDRQNISALTGTLLDGEGYDRAGFNPDGRDRAGYDREGFNTEGFNREGYDLEGFTVYGYDREGYNREGFNSNGFNRENIHRITGTPYNPDGFTSSGRDEEGFSRSGSDLFGFQKTDASFGSKYLGCLAGWNYNIPEGIRIKNGGRNYKKEGWVRSAGQGFNPKLGIYELPTLVTHKDTGTRFNPDGFNIIGVNADGINERGFDLSTKLHVETGTKYDTKGVDLFKREFMVADMWN